MSQYEDDSNFGLESNPTNAEGEISLAKTKCVELYYAPGNSRALHLVLANGERLFFHYFSLPKGCCSANENIITLIFSGEKVVLKGRNLLSLYKAISQQLVLEIACSPERYNEMLGDKEIVVNEIDILAS